MTERYRYVTPDEDSARWEQFALREGDIVVSSRSKHGTTWLQMILLLLIHRRPELPAPLAQLSPWLDHRVEPIADVTARLDAQTHRRVIKTHTPLDGLPLLPHVTYMVIARHPLDAAVSLYHQGANIDRDRLASLTGTAAASDGNQRPPLRAWLRRWIAATPAPRTDLDSLLGVLLHLGDAWSRRDQANVVLVHFADLARDLAAQMRTIAHRLGLAVDDDELAPLVAAASFASMRSRAARFVPDRHGVLRQPAAFFRSGTSGAATRLLTTDEIAAYDRDVRATIPAQLHTWLHR